MLNASIERFLMNPIFQLLFIVIVHGDMAVSKKIYMLDDEFESLLANSYFDLNNETMKGYGSRDLEIGFSNVDAEISIEKQLFIQTSLVFSSIIEGKIWKIKEESIIIKGFTTEVAFINISFYIERLGQAKILQLPVFSVKSLAGVVFQNSKFIEDGIPSSGFLEAENVSSVNIMKFEVSSKNLSGTLFQIRLAYIIIIKEFSFSQVNASIVNNRFLISIFESDSVLISNFSISNTVFQNCGLLLIDTSRIIHLDLILIQSLSFLQKDASGTLSSYLHISNSFLLECSNITATNYSADDGNDLLGFMNIGNYFSIKEAVFKSSAGSLLRGENAVNSETKILVESCFICYHRKAYFSLSSPYINLNKVTILESIADSFPMFLLRNSANIIITSIMIIEGKFFNENGVIFEVLCLYYYNEAEITFDMRESIFYKNKVQENTSLYTGGEWSLIINIPDRLSKIYFSNNIVDSNYVSYMNNIFFLKGGSNVFMNNSIISRNNVDGPKGSFVGQFFGNYIELNNTIILKNSAAHSNGLVSRSLNKTVFRTMIFYKNTGLTGIVMNLPDNIEHEYSELQVYGSILAENVAVKYNIYLGDVKFLICGLLNSTFFHNHGGPAGVLKIYCSTSEEGINFYGIQIVQCFFAGNSAHRGGISNIALYRGLFYIYNSIFYKNEAANVAAIISTYAGYWMNISSVDCFFAMNSAGRASLFYFIDGNYKDNGSIFFGNFAIQEASLHVGSNSIFEFIYSSFFDCYSTFSNNIVFSECSKGYFYSVMIRNSSSKLNAAGLSIYRYAEIRLELCSFIDIRAPTGAIIYSSNSVLTVLMIDCIIINSTALKNMIYLSMAHLAIHNITMIGNRGLIYFLSSNASILINNSFVGDHTCEKGSIGCILSIKSKSQASLNFVFVKGIASVSKSIIKLEYCSLEIFQVEVSERGGKSLVVYILSEYSSLNITSCKFSIEEEQFIYVKYTNVLVLDSIFQSTIITASNTCALRCLFSNITIENSFFSDFTQSTLIYQGELKNDFTIFNTASINNCTFKNSSSSFGGALILLNMNLKIIDSFFLNNKAFEWGGAVFLACNPLLSDLEDLKRFFFLKVSEFKCLWNFQNNHFSANAASKGGGAIFWLNVPPIILPPVINYFENNSAPFGDIIATKGMHFQVENETVLFQLQNFTSGSELKGPITMTLTDYYGQIAYTTPISPTTINLVDLYLASNKNQYYLGVNNDYKILLGKTTTTVSEGRIEFSNLRIMALPTYTLSLMIRSVIVPYFEEALSQGITQNERHHVLENGEYAFVLNISFLPCLPGQIFNSERNTCTDCQEGTFNLYPTEKDSACNSCPKNAFCLGRNQIYVKKGFWRSSMNSTTIYKCKNRFSCKGGISDICFYGYEGLLCDSCALTSNRNDIFFLDVDKKCKSCRSSDKLKSIGLSILFVCLLALYLIIMIKRKMKSLTSSSSVLIKILTDYIQVLGIVTSIPSSWPEDILDIFQVQGNMNNPSSLMSSIDCSFALFYEDVNVFFKKIVLSSILTLVLPFCIYIFWKLYSALKNMRKSLYEYSLETSLMIVFYTFQPSFINQFFTGVTCREIESNYYLDKFVGQECWTASHLKIVFIFIIPTLSLWMFFVPLFLIWKILRKFKLGHHMEAYSYITYGYQDKYFYWDLVNMLFKYTFIAATTFILDELGLLFILIFLLFIFLYFQSVFAPYSNVLFNRIALTSRISIMCILFCTIINKVETSAFVLSLVLATLGVMNLFFFISWAISFLQFQKSFVIIWNRYCPIEAFKVDLYDDTVSSLVSLVKGKTKKATMTTLILTSGAILSDKGQSRLITDNSLFSFQNLKKM